MKKLLIADTIEELESVEANIKVAAGIDSAITFANVYEKFDQTAYWYNISGVERCTSDENVLSLVDDYMSGLNLPSGVILAQVEDMVEEGYTEGFTEE